MKKFLQHIIDNHNSREWRIFDYTIQVLIWLSVFLFTVETIPNKSVLIDIILKYSEWVFIVVFSVEYLARIYAAKKPFSYIFSFYGIIDLVSVLPFYLSYGFDLIFIRLFRILRLFRIFKLLRYNRAFNRLRVAMSMAKEEIYIFLLLVFIILYFSAVGIYYFEYDAQPHIFSDIFHSMYWALITLATVWYGDMVPITTGGKFFTFFILIAGVWVVTIPAWLVASAMTQARRLETIRVQQLLKEKLLLGEDKEDSLMNESTELSHERKKINNIDKEILQLFAKRFRIVSNIGKIKKDMGIRNPLDMKRWKSLISKNKKLWTKNWLDTKFIEDVWNRIHEESLKIEKKEDN